MRIRTLGIVAVVLIAGFVPSIGYTQDARAAQAAPAKPDTVKPLPDVCGTVADKPVCVPASIFAATFATWKPGDISPLAVEQAAHSDTYARWRNADHQLAAARAELAKAIAPKESESLEAMRAGWLKSVQAAAPDGQVFDEKTGKYIPKPPAKPEDKPKTGGGGL